MRIRGAREHDPAAGHVLQHDGVDAQLLGGLRQAPVLKRHLDLRQCEDALLVHVEHPERVGPLETHIVVGHALARQQARRVRLVAAQLERHRNLARVLHGVRLHDGCTLKREIHAQPEVEGKDRPRPLVGNRLEARMRARHLLGRERAVAAASVHGSVHALAAVRVPAVAQAPDQREQERRPTAPYHRVARPHPLDPLAHDALQLCALARYAHRERIVLQDHSRLFHRRPPFASIACPEHASAYARILQIRRHIEVCGSCNRPWYPTLHRSPYFCSFCILPVI